jgi:hypothetical protein
MKMRDPRVLKTMEVPSNPMMKRTQRPLNEIQVAAQPASAEDPVEVKNLVVRAMVIATMSKITAQMTNGPHNWNILPNSTMDVLSQAL